MLVAAGDKACLVTGKGFGAGGRVAALSQARDVACSVDEPPAGNRGAIAKRRVQILGLDWTGASDLCGPRGPNATYLASTDNWPTTLHVIVSGVFVEALTPTSTHAPAPRTVLSNAQAFRVSTASWSRDGGWIGGGTCNAPYLLARSRFPTEGWVGASHQQPYRALSHVGGPLGLPVQWMAIAKSHPLGCTVALAQGCATDWARWWCRRGAPMGVDRRNLLRPLLLRAPRAGVRAVPAAATATACGPHGRANDSGHGGARRAARGAASAAAAPAWPGPAASARHRCLQPGSAGSGSSRSTTARGGAHGVLCIIDDCRCSSQRSPGAGRHPAAGRPQPRQRCCGHCRGSPICRSQYKRACTPHTGSSGGDGNGAGSGARRDALVAQAAVAPRRAVPAAPVPP